MLPRLAAFLHAHGRRVLVGAVICAVVAGVFGAGMGLGLAIDYSLFMVSRYREESAKHDYGAQALTRTLQTAGRTV